MAIINTREQNEELVAAVKLVAFRLEEIHSEMKMMREAQQSIAAILPLK